MKIGILTSGGDCPGLNADIRGVVLKGTTAYDLEVVGIGVFRAVILADSTFPVPHELVPPREERLAVVRACVLHGCHLEGAVCADVDGS